jgi:endonuclease/exonuclease/phosphatase family metal-dependent hydrolase
VKVEFGNTEINVITTHLGLSNRERILQAQELAGKNWLGHPLCQGPTVLCGDFNVLATSSVWRMLSGELTDACRLVPRQRRAATWFGRYPLVRIDHIFVSNEVTVRTLEVGGTHLCRLASDHRPVIAELEVKQALSSGSRQMVKRS